MTPRKYVYELLHSPKIDSKLEYFLRALITILIVLSIISVMLETVEEVFVRYEFVFHYFEIFTITVFSLEYVLRVWSIVEVEKFKRPIFGRMRYMCSFMSMVDLFAILPFYAPNLIAFDMRFLRGFRLLRLLRILKLGQYSTSIKTISTVLHKKRFDILVTFFIIFLLLVLSSSAMYFIERDAQPDVFRSIPASLWWGVSTLTTIGYGDVVPITTIGRICSAIISILGIGTFALPSGIIVSGLIDEMKLQKDTDKKLIYCPYCKEKLPH